MVSLIVIGIAALVLLVIWIKTKETGHKTKFIALILVILVLFGTVGYVWLQTKPNLATYDGFVSLGKSYFAWVASFFHNAGSVTSYAVQQDWGINKTVS